MIKIPTRKSGRSKARIINPKDGFWNQERLYRGERYTRHSGYPGRTKALKIAKDLREKGKKAHVAQDKTDRKNFAVWWQRDQ